MLLNEAIKLILEKYKEQTKYYSIINIRNNTDGSCSVSADKLLIFKVYEQKNKYKLCVKYDLSTLNKADAKDGFVKYDIPLNNPEALEYYIKLVYVGIDKYIVENYSAESFGCCSRYIECSDEKKCIHPDQLHAQGCMYKKNLDAGRIFYGKNKNTG